jgi:hypothetical protein
MTELESAVLRSEGEPTNWRVNHRLAFRCLPPALHVESAHDEGDRDESHAEDAAAISVVPSLTLLIPT